VTVTLVAGSGVGIVAGGVLGPLAGLLVPQVEAHEKAPLGTPASAEHYAMPALPHDLFEAEPRPDDPAPPGDTTRG